MTPNFVTTFSTFPEPRIDAGQLIDQAFPGEPVRQAARAVVARLLTDGEKFQYADGRVGLYLEPDQRPEVQALLDGMPAGDRQRLLELLDKTVASPALEGLILGRWPSRGFLLEARAAFRTPELREHLRAAPSQVFLEKLSGAKRALQDRSPESPVRALLDLLARLERDVCRTPSGDPVRLDEYAVRCRCDAQTLALTRELTKEIQDTAVALFQALRGAASSFLPRTPGCTGGEGEELNVIDRADVADHCSFLCCVAAEILEQSRAPGAPDKAREITGRVVTCMAHSVIEALLLTFLQRRFPGLAVPADAEAEGWQPQSAEENERVREQLKRKVPVFLQALSLFASFREAARARPALFLRGKVDPAGELIGSMLGALEDSVRGWANLRVFSDSVQTPRCVAPSETHYSIFLHPLPDLSLLHCVEEAGPRPSARAPSLRIAATYCKHQPGAKLVHSAGTIYPDGGSVGADISLHAPGRGACLSPITCVPVSQLLHPEDPASIVAAFLARQAGRDVPEILKMLQAFGVGQQAREAAADVPRLDFLHVQRAVRGRVFFWRKRTEHFVCLIMRRQDAVRLGILRRVRALPPREQALLREYFHFCPERPVGLRIECSDDRDDGGDGPPPPPPPAPEPREVREGAPTRDKVGVG